MVIVLSLGHALRRALVLCGPIPSWCMGKLKLFGERGWMNGEELGPSLISNYP